VKVALIPLLVTFTDKGDPATARTLPPDHWIAVLKVFYSRSVSAEVVRTFVAARFRRPARLTLYPRDRGEVAVVTGADHRGEGASRRGIALVDAVYSYRGPSLGRMVAKLFPAVPNARARIAPSRRARQTLRRIKYGALRLSRCQSGRAGLRFLAGLRRTEGGLTCDPASVASMIRPSICDVEIG